jgi:hypothetical protein
MIDPELAVVRLTTLAPDTNGSALQTFLRQWASFAEAIKLYGETSEHAAIWLDRIRTSEEKEKLSQPIQQKPFDYHPVKAFMMPINQLPEATPLQRAASKVFRSHDCLIAFEVADLKVPIENPSKLRNHQAFNE